MHAYVYLICICICILRNLYPIPDVPTLESKIDKFCLDVRYMYWPTLAQRVEFCGPFHDFGPWSLDFQVGYLLLGRVQVHCPRFAGCWVLGATHLS
jgi:hypothetical protein